MAENAPTRDLELFKKAMDAMVVKNDRSWEDYGTRWTSRHLKDYTKEEVARILSSNSLEA
jgi:hypothetical protein